MVYKPALFLLIGVMAGLYTAQKAVDDQSGPFARQQGEWTAWQAPVSTGDDPYTRGHTIGKARLEPSALETITYRATRDRDSNVLDPACVYTLTGRLDTVRWWRIAAEPRDRDGDMARGTMATADALFTDDGSFVITVSRAPAPGNWLLAPDSRSMSLILRLYGPRRTIRDDRVETRLPSISRMACT